MPNHRNVSWQQRSLYNGLLAIGNWARHFTIHRQDETLGGSAFHYKVVPLLTRTPVCILGVLPTLPVVVHVLRVLASATTTDFY